MTALMTPAPPTDRTTWWQRTVGGLPRVYWTVVSGAGVARLGFAVVLFLPYYLGQARALSGGQIAIVVTAWGAGWSASHPLGGWLADRVGRRRTLIVGACSAAAAYLLLGAAREMRWLVLAAFVAGCTYDLCRPAVLSLIADHVAPDRRTQAFALFNLVFNAAVGTAVVVGGVLADQSFWVLFACSAAANLLYAAAAWALIPPDPAISAASRGPSWREALADPLLLGFAAISLAMFIIYMQAIVSLPIVIGRAGIGPDVFGLIVAVNPIAVVVLQLLLQGWLVVWPAPRVCAAGAVLVGAGLGLTAFGDTAVWFAITCLVWTLGEVLFMAVAPAVVADIAPAHLRGIYNGVWGMTLGLAAMLAPLAATGVVAIGGYDALWAACAAAGPVVAGGCLLYGPALARRRRPQPPEHREATT